MIPRLHSLCTVALLILIALPFTAPFSTCRVSDLFDGVADLSGQVLVLPPPPADGANDSKATVHATAVVVFSPLSLARADRVLGLDVRSGPRQLSFTVIRV